MDAADDATGATDVVALPAGTFTLTHGALDAVTQPVRVRRGLGPDAHRARPGNVILFRVKPGGELALAGPSLDTAGVVGATRYSPG